MFFLHWVRLCACCLVCEVSVPNMLLRVLRLGTTLANDFGQAICTLLMEWSPCHVTSSATAVLADLNLMHGRCSCVGGREIFCKLDDRLSRVSGCRTALAELVWKPFKRIPP
jgi:hypothetical protein